MRRHLLIPGPAILPATLTGERGQSARPNPLSVEMFSPANMNEGSRAAELHDVDLGLDAGVALPEDGQVPLALVDVVFDLSALVARRTLGASASRRDRRSPPSSRPTTSIRGLGPLPNVRCSPSPRRAMLAATTTPRRGRRSTMRSTMRSTCSRFSVQTRSRAFATPRAGLSTAHWKRRIASVNEARTCRDCAALPINDLA